MSSQWVAIAVSAMLAAAALVVSVRNQRRTEATSKEANEIARRALKQAEDQAARYVVPWELTHASGTRYQLVNMGDEDAHGVRIEGPNVHQGSTGTRGG